MDSEEIKSLIEQLKAQGLSEEEIMDSFYQTFEQGKMDRKDLETLAEAMGYELTDDFKNDSTPDPIEEKDVGGMSKEELEDARTIEPGESKEEFKEELEGASEGLDEEKDVEAEEEEKEKSESEDEKFDDEEWAKAQKMFKI